MSGLDRSPTTQTPLTREMHLRCLGCLPAPPCKLSECYCLIGKEKASPAPPKEAKGRKGLVLVQVIVVRTKSCN